MGDDYHASPLASIETFGICSDGSRSGEHVLEESDNPELCLLQQKEDTNLQAPNCDTGQFSNCFGCAFSSKAHRTSHVAERTSRDPYKLLRGFRRDETSRCRKWDMRTRLANFIQTDDQLEFSGGCLVRQNFRFRAL